MCCFSSSFECQQSHWKSGHKAKCKDFRDTGALNSAQNGATNRGFKASAVGGKSPSSIALVPGCGTSRPIKQPKDVIFFYESIDKFTSGFAYPR